MKKYLYLILFLIVCVFPASVALAQLPTLPGSSGGTSLVNPLGNNTTITSFFLKILDIIMVFAIPIIVLFIIFAGFQYVTANGNSEKVKSATSALTWAVIGGVLILGARVILVVIQNTVNALR